MTRQMTLLLLSASLSIVAGYFHHYLDLKAVSEKSPVILAVFMAAIFVRLARGLPTFPFDKIEHGRAKLILESLSHLRRLYGQAFASFLAALVISIGYSATFDQLTNETLQAIMTAFLVFLLTWSLCISYLLYNTDITLFKAQADATHTIVDKTAEESADETVANVRNSFRP